MQITPVILSGGSGTRLWPLSRESYPKQFLQIFDGLSLFQRTCDRVNKNLFAPPLVLANHAHRFLIEEQLEELKTTYSGIILEPDLRNTAPAALISALFAAERDENALLLLLPSDHYITDHTAFIDVVRKAIPAAQSGAIVTFGIRPDRPHTGYGYIKINRLSDACLTLKDLSKNLASKPQRPILSRENICGTRVFFWHPLKHSSQTLNTTHLTCSLRAAKP